MKKKTKKQYLLALKLTDRTGEILTFPTAKARALALKDMRREFPRLKFATSEAST